MALRLFLALDLPSAVERQLSRACRDLAPRLPPARWTAPAALHLTLVFLGDTPAARVAELGRCLEPVFGAAKQLPVEICGVGAFPSPRRAGVVWIGVDGGGVLEALQRRAAAVVAEVTGAAAEARRYRPHLTLARCRPPWPAAAVRRLADQLDGVPCMLERATLYASELRPTGARHRPLRRFPLAQR